MYLAELLRHCAKLSGQHAYLIVTIVVRFKMQVTGLADALIMLGYAYGGSASLEFTRRVMRSNKRCPSA